MRAIDGMTRRTDELRTERIYSVVFTERDGQVAFELLQLKGQPRTFAQVAEDLARAREWVVSQARAE